MTGVRQAFGKPSEEKASEVTKAFEFIKRIHHRRSDLELGAAGKELVPTFGSLCSQAVPASGRRLHRIRSKSQTPVARDPGPDCLFLCFRERAPSTAERAGRKMWWFVVVDVAPLDDGMPG